MENVTLQLSSGYVVTFKPYMTYGQKRQISEVVSSKMSIDPFTQQSTTQIDGGTLMQAQDLAAKLMIVSVQLSDGTVAIGDTACQAVQNMRDTDGEAMYVKVDEVSSAIMIEEDKKN